MNSSTTVRVVAMSDKDVFIAVHDDVYCVFSRSDTRALSIGDILKGAFHGRGSSCFDAANLTSQDTVRVDLEDWESTLDRAIKNILTLSSPRFVWVGSIQISANLSGAAEKIANEVARSI